jgi:hypothetical protein
MTCQSLRRTRVISSPCGLGNMGIGSKNASATTAVNAVGITLLGLTFLPFVYTLPYYVNMILQVPFALFSRLALVLLQLSSCFHHPCPSCRAGMHIAPRAL